MSDWSSDVFSSDLTLVSIHAGLDLRLADPTQLILKADLTRGIGRCRDLFCGRTGVPPFRSAGCDNEHSKRRSDQSASRRLSVALAVVAEFLTRTERFAHPHQTEIGRATWRERV